MQELLKMKTSELIGTWILSAQMKEIWLKRSRVSSNYDSNKRNNVI